MDRIRNLAWWLTGIGFLFMLLDWDSWGWRLSGMGMTLQVALWVFHTLPFSSAIEFWIAKYCVPEHD